MFPRTVKAREKEKRKEKIASMDLGVLFDFSDRKPAKFWNIP